MLSARLPWQMAALAQSGRFELGETSQQLSDDFDAASASEADVAEAIRSCKARCGYLADPHTACGLVAAERVLGESADAALSALVAFVESWAASRGRSDDLTALIVKAR